MEDDANEPVWTPGERAHPARSGLDRGLWRVRAAIGFASYFLLSIGLGWCVLPIQHAFGRLRGESQPEREVRSQRWVHRATRRWARLVTALGVFQARYEGLERLTRRPLLIVANHPSLVDTPVLTCCLPQADFVVSEEWLTNPVLRETIRRSGYLKAESGPLVIRDAVRRLRAGRTLVVYPEGSRTPEEGLREFQKGAAFIALAAGCEIVPALIRVTPRAFMKGQGVFDYPEVAPLWSVAFGDPIDPADYLAGGEGRSAAAARLTAALQDDFEKRWERGSG